MVLMCVCVLNCFTQVGPNRNLGASECVYVSYCYLGVCVVYIYKLVVTKSQENSVGRPYNYGLTRPRPLVEPPIDTDGYSTD